MGYRLGYKTVNRTDQIWIHIKHINSKIILPNATDEQGITAHSADTISQIAANAADYFALIDNECIAIELERTSENVIELCTLLQSIWID